VSAPRPAWQAIETAQACEVERLPELLAHLEHARAVALGRLITAAATPPPAPAADRFLKVAEAAAVLGVSTRWIYRRRATLPFVRQRTGTVVRVSERDLRAWMERRA
jgi:excisionase family DNA binding protein